MLRLLYTLTFLLYFSTSFSQKINLQEALAKSPVDSQFYYLSAMSRSQDADFKIIRKTNLAKIRRNVLDTVNGLRTEITALHSTNSSAASTLKNLKDSVQNLQVQLNQEKIKTDSITFLGIDFSKASYHTLVWLLICGLAIAFVATLVVFQKAKVDSTEAKSNASEFQNELLAFKKKSLEKEQVLKRQLLDEQLKRSN